MITPEYMARAPNNIEQIYQKLWDYIIADIARRLKATGAITATAEWQAFAAQSIGASLDQIQVEVARITGKAEAEVMSLFDDAARRALRYDRKIYEDMGLTPPELDNSAELKKVLEAAEKQTRDELRNISQSMGFAEKMGGKIVYKPIAKFYQDMLDFAHFKISTGAVNAETAIREAVKSLCDSGLRTVDYASGWSNQVNVAVRRAVMTGISQMAGQYADMRAKDLDTDLMEISAHSAARPDHARWQGKVVSKTGRKGYLSLADIGYGDVRGFKGANCRHDWHPFVEGVSSRTYTDEQLREIDPPPFVFDGITYDAYAATQQLRKIESAIRRSKRFLIAYKEAGLESDYTDTAVKLRRQHDLYNRFTEAAKLKPQTQRSQIYGFGRKEAAQASATARKAAAQK